MGVKYIPLPKDFPTAQDIRNGDLHAEVGEGFRIECDHPFNYSRTWCVADKTDGLWEPIESGLTFRAAVASARRHATERRTLRSLGGVYKVKPVGGKT